MGGKDIRRALTGEVDMEIDHILAPRSISATSHAAKLLAGLGKRPQFTLRPVLQDNTTSLCLVSSLFYMISGKGNSKKVPPKANAGTGEGETSLG